MKKYNLLFWSATALFAAFMLFSAYSYLTSEEMKSTFILFGLSDFFRIGLAIAKIMGALALILPFIPRPLKIAAYMGFGINLISAIVIHIMNGYHSYGLIAFAIILVSLSYYSYAKLQLINKK